MEAYFFTSPSLLKPLHKIQNDALRLRTGAMASTTPLICLHHACDEMPLLIRHKFLCLKFKAHLLTFSDHRAQSLIEDCWQERFPDSPRFCFYNMFTKVAVDHSLAHPEYSSLIATETPCRLRSLTVRPSNDICVRCPYFLVAFTQYIWPAC